MSETVKVLKFDEARRQMATEFAEKVPYARLLGIELAEIGSGEAVMKLKMRDELSQPHGVMHGGATASLIDSAMAFAIISVLAEDEKATTVDLTVHYLRPVSKGEITCRAKVLRAGKRLITVSADVENEEGKLVATALSTYSKF